ncbi:hypothetical protein ACA910_013327 [Epithemia clementina (nom. ined.)]
MMPYGSCTVFALDKARSMQRVGVTIWSPCKASSLLQGRGVRKLRPWGSGIRTFYSHRWPAMDRHDSCRRGVSLTNHRQEGTRNPIRRHSLVSQQLICRDLSSSLSGSSLGLSQQEQEQKQNYFSSPTLDDIAQVSKLLDHETGCVISTLTDKNKNGQSESSNSSSSSLLDRYNADWTKHYMGHSRVVVRPRTTEQVARLVQYCASRRLAIVPQGGNTGLVGGSVPVHPNEIVLSLERMNQIYHVDPVTGILYCQAGCILNDLQKHCAEQANLLVPVDLGAKGSCQIGGNLATNAGGQYYYRYGSLAANLVGMQVVWPGNGTTTAQVANINFYPTDGPQVQQEQQPAKTPSMPSSFQSNLKDNTGYKLSQLMIGSEGTLGIITGVALKCSPLPRSRQAAFLACETFDQVVQLIQLAKQELGEILAALEWMDQSILQTILHSSAGPKLKLPVAVPDSSSDNKGIHNSPYPHSVLLETHGSCPEHDVEKLDRFLTKVMQQQESSGSPIVQDGVLAQDLTQLNDFWYIRELAGVAISELGYGYKYDLSLPVSQFWEFSHEIQQHVKLNHTGKSLVLCTNFGHVLDGNLHLNFTTPGRYQEDPELLSCLEPFVFEQVLKRGGSISAEHGIGQFKRQYLMRVHGPELLDTMRALKQVFDPVGILNPNKVLP